MSILAKKQNTKYSRVKTRDKASFARSQTSNSVQESYRKLQIESEGNIYNTKKVAKKVVSTVLKVAGVHDRGRLNYHNIEVIDNDVTCKDLPWSLDGLKVLHLSNLYWDSDKRISETIFSKLRDINYDICVLSGGIGFRSKSQEDLVEAAKDLMDALKGNVYIVPGVGDRPELMEALALQGANILSNDSSTVRFLTEDILVYGSDCMHSAHYNELDELDSVKSKSSFSIFVSQNPHRSVDAEKAGYDLMLSGLSNCQHCALSANCHLMSGVSRTSTQVESYSKVNDMLCYVTSGVGSSFLPVRYFSQPEIVIHTIKPA